MVLLAARALPSPTGADRCALQAARRLVGAHLQAAARGPQARDQHGGRIVGRRKMD